MEGGSHFLTVFVIWKICGLSSVESSPDPDAVRFPDSRNFRSILPCPNNEHFCNRVNDYPSNFNLDDNLLSNTLIKKKIFDDKVITASDYDIGTRISSQEERACRFRRSVVYPKKARNVKGQFLFIVNNSKYRQAVEIEQCLGEGENCLTDSDAPYPKATVCKQKYATYKLYAITSELGQVYDSFSLPSACLCHYKSPTSSRSAIRVKTRTTSTLPICKAGTKLNIQNSNTFQSATNTQNSQFQQQVQNQPQEFRTSISGRPPSRTQSQRQTDGLRQTSGRQRINRGYKQNIQSAQQRNPSNQRRNRRNKRRYSNPQTQNRSNRWQRDIRRIGVSSGCDNTQSTFCQSPRDYPGNLFLSKLMNNPDVSGEVFKQVFDGQCTSRIATRSFAIDEEQLCSGRQNVIFPRKAMNMDNKWKFVVNIDNFTQSVEIEECDNSYGFSQDSSDEFGVCLYSGSEGNNPDLTSCKQLYTEHKLLALTEAGQLEVDRFMLPSACACYVNNNFNVPEFRL
eukprot:GFUD01015404.1.p1 GENE.GFUD01015404.1~~GFUD01015404.1.p1  ORF type:complete len:510 (-),score=86.92 GFUD01015404.1:496-2025(-)